MTDEGEILDFEKNIPSLESSPGLTYQSITEAECQKASSAYREFEQKHFDHCLKTLKSLQNNRPQDTKVFHNLCVAEFYQSNCCKITDLYSNLLSVCKQANIDIEEIDSIDDVDQCVVFFNRAIILYHLYKYRGAIRILDKVFQFVEPLDEVLGKKICLLLLELYLSTYQPKKALGLIGYIEAMLLSTSTGKSSKSPDKEENKESNYMDDLKLKLVQSKARCYTMMKTAKPCKREVKALLTSGSKTHHIAAFLIKSQLEYQRGNYRKAIKILNSPEWPTDYSKYFLETGDCLQSVYYNNLGCIHYYMGKPSLGAFYTERGLKELDEEIKKVRQHNTTDMSSVQPLHTLNLGTRKKLLYNLGMQYFQRQKYHEAFHHFMDVSECFFENPRLWLRIAECCIQIHRQNTGKDKHYQTVKAVIGAGKHRKFILNPANEPSVSRQGNESSDGTTANLSFAICALKNALTLLPKDVPAGELTESTHTSSQSVEEKDINPLEENCLQCPPCSAIPTTEIQSLRNAILIALSYVSLRLGDLILAHDYALQLLSQPRISEAHKYLAHMYAGEALVYLDKISQAVDHFHPELFSDITQTLPPCSEDVFIKHQNKADTPDRTDDSDRFSKLKPAWSPDNLVSARLIAQYNLSVVYALRGEWFKALRLATEIIDDEKAPPQAKALIVYIHLCQGATDVALSYLNQCVGTHQR